MQSSRAKVLHPLAGRPMLGYVLDTAGLLAPDRLLVVVGHQADKVKKAFPGSGIEYVLQAPQLGTGHAIAVTRQALEKFAGDVLILCGDMPLIRAATLRRLIGLHFEKKAACTFLSLQTSKPCDFGRVVRNPQGGVVRIVEDRDANPQEKTIDEYNSGVYCFDKFFLFNALENIGQDNSQNEYYLTDTISCLVRDGHRVEAMATTDDAEILGINRLEDLARAEDLLSFRGESPPGPA